MRKLSLIFFTTLILTSCGQQQANSIQEGTALKTFLASSNKPAIIKFYASWCSSCKQYAPAFNEVKLATSASVDFFEVDVDSAASKDLVKELKVARIPETVFVSKDRAAIARRLGAISVNELSKLVDELKAK